MFNHIPGITNPITEPGWVPLFSSSQYHLFGRVAPDHEPAQPSAMLVDLPIHVPVMHATVLGLELLLQESFIDLRLAAELVLSDVGATLQILRLTGREFEDAEDRPTRIEDCIASLDVEDWFAAVSAHAVARDGDEAVAVALGEHSRLIAQYAQLVAESLDGVCPEEAYVVGLLHAIDTIPGGLPGKRSPHQMAKDWYLPAFVIEAFSFLKESGSSSQWTRILAAAHELAGVPCDDFPAGLHS